MPMDYVFSTISLGFKISTLLAGAMLFSGGNWVQALGAGQQIGVDKTGYTTPARTRYMTLWSDVTAFVAHDNNRFSDVFVHDHLAGSTARISVDDAGFAASGWGVYMHDRLTMTTFRARLNIAQPGPAGTGYRHISERLRVDNNTIAMEVAFDTGKVSLPVSAGWAATPDSATS